MGMTLAEALAAVETHRTVYTVDGTGVTLNFAGIDSHGVPYGLYVLADPDDGELIETTEDLEWLHLNQQVSTKRLERPCMCEHTNHFDDGFGPRVAGKHVYLDEAAGQREARYVGAVCDECAQTCMASYLI